MTTPTPATFSTKLKTFSGTGFPAWGALMKLVLEIKELWDACQVAAPTETELRVERDAVVAAAAAAEPAPPTPFRELVMKQKMASSIVMSALSEKVAAEVYLLDHPMAIMRHPRMTYNVKCSASVGAAKREYMALYLDDDGSMLDHIKETRRVLDELQELHVTLVDEEKMQNFLQSIGPSWNGFVGVLEAATSFENMIQRCQAEAVRREQQKTRTSRSPSSRTSAAFTAEQVGRRTNKKKRDMSKVKCFNCQRYGHISRDCKNPRVPRATRPETASMAFSVEDATVENQHEWIVDSGATSHMTGHVANLIDVRELEQPRVLTVASGDNLVATAVGKAPLRCDGQEVCVLHDVLFVKGLARNLVSVAAASRNGMEVLFKGASCTIRGPSGASLTASRERHLVYVVDAKSEPVQHSAQMTAEVPHVETWHRRLGHLNVASTKKVIADLQLPARGTMDQSCPTCVSGKLAQFPFPVKEKRVLKDNQLLLAIDYVGPMNTRAREGYTGMVNIVIEPFHLDMVYPLRDKSSITQLDAIKDCAAKMRAFAPTFRVAFLKSDNAQEYVGGAVAEYCKRNGIIQEFSVAYTPQQNGKAERANRVIVEMARSMMIGANLPTTYWADAVVCAAYLRNRCPSKVLDGKTPMEVLLGTAADISNLRVFGCKVQALVPKEQRKKLDTKARNGIFVGYASGGAYLVHIPSRGRGETITARTVVFYEDQFLPPPGDDEVVIDTELSLAQRLERQLSIAAAPQPTTQEPDESAGQLVSPAHGSPAGLDVHMTPSEMVTPPDQPTSGPASQPVGGAQQLARLRGDPREEKAVPPVRRSAREKKPSQRRLDYDESHLSMAEVCAMVEERVLPARFDGTNVRDAYIYRVMTPSELDEWALSIDPINIEEVRSSAERSEWEHAMEAEIESLIANGTFVEAPLPPGRKAVKSKWVFKRKTHADGSLDKFKARVVAKGFSQRYGDDYSDTFSPVVRHTTVRIVLIIAVERRMKRLQLDIKTAFLNSPLNEEIYMEPVEGYKNGDGAVWLLRRALYGLKQASRSWYETLSKFLLSIGFRRGVADTCLFMKGSDDDLMIVLVYVDDILAFAMRDEDLNQFKTAMETEYEVNNFDDINYFLGLELQWSPAGDEVRVCQQKYATTILERFNMENSRAAATPMEDHFRNQLFQTQDASAFKPRPALGALLYLAVISRPDVATAVRLLAQETEQPTPAVQSGIERVFRYVNGTRDYGLTFKQNRDVEDGLVVYCDAAFAVERNSRSSTGFAIFYNGNLVEWGSKKQDLVTLSSTEAEYVAMTQGVQECIALKLVLKDIGIPVPKLLVKEDNQGAQHIAENKGTTQRSRHIDTKYHWLREKVATQEVEVQYCPTGEMVADHFTKPLGRAKFVYFREQLGIRRVGVLDARPTKNEQATSAVQQ